MNEQMQKDIARIAKVMDWLENGISVNGSKGLEPILRDQHQKQIEHGKAIDANNKAIEDLMIATQAERSRRKLLKAANEYLSARPGLKVLLGAIGTLVLTIIGAILKHYFHLF